MLKTYNSKPSIYELEVAPRVKLALLLFPSPDKQTGWVGDKFGAPPIKVLPFVEENLYPVIVAESPRCFFFFILVSEL